MYDILNIHLTYYKNHFVYRVSVYDIASCIRDIDNTLSFHALNMYT